jgi:hypothetical protein
LWQELTEQGYGGSYKSPHNYLGRHFSSPSALPALPSPAVQLGDKRLSVRQIHRNGGPPMTPTTSPRQALWMLLKPEKLKEPEQEVIKRLVELSPEIKKAVKLADNFYQ